MEHRPSKTPRHRTLFWAALVTPDQLVPCCFSSASVSRFQLLRSQPLFLFPCGFRSGLGVYCWMLAPWGCVRSSPTSSAVSAWPLVPVRLLPQIFISDLLLPLDFVEAPHAGVEECLDLLLHRLCCLPCLTSVEQDWLHNGVEDAEFG